MNELLLKPTNAVKFEPSCGKDKFRLNQIHVEFVQQDENFSGGNSGEGGTSTSFESENAAVSGTMNETPKEIQISVEFMRFGENRHDE